MTLMLQKIGKRLIYMVTKILLAQDHLGEVVFVDLPESGKSVTKGSSFGAVESVKATSDINSPISGEVIEVNLKLSDSPGLVTSMNFLHPFICSYF